MKLTEAQLCSTRRPRSRIGLGAALTVFALALAGSAGADNTPTLADVVRGRETVRHPARQLQPAPSDPEAAAARLADEWGVEVTSIRLSAHDHMIDFRYRVLDAAKAADLFKRQIKPRLIHDKTGRVLIVPDTAKVGPLRNSDIPKEGRIYWMFFGNAGDLVKAGDKVTIQIGDFLAEDLVVE